ncbi:MAG: threonine synthase, partial [Spirochaetes bacterium]|nr:threonine synthase [Spirochaetota bacterium]
SNAMDVGSPSNFERLDRLFGGDWKAMGAVIRGAAVTDERTLKTIREIHAQHGVFVDPHTAVGCAAAKDLLRLDGTFAGEQIVVLSTAHPAKFMDVVKEATGCEPEMPERLARCLVLPKQALEIGPTLPELSRFLLEKFA